MMFTSTTRESVSGHRPGGWEPDGSGRQVRSEDPKPWVHPTGWPRSPERDTFLARGNTKVPQDYRPRPEYRAPANPILVRLRVHLVDGTPTWPAAQDMLNLLAVASTRRINPRWLEDALPEHIEHARKVLSRLVGLA